MRPPLGLPQQNTMCGKSEEVPLLGFLDEEEDEY
jgi:hypothetical protein